MKALKLLSFLLVGLLAGELAHAEQPVMADAEISLRFEVPAVHCLVRLYGTFDDRRSRHVADFDLEGTPFTQGRWLTARGQMPIPVSSLLTLSVSLLDADGENACELETGEGRVFIKYLRLTFDHPDKGGRVTRTVIGGVDDWLTKSTASIGLAQDDPSIRFETDDRAIARYFKPVDLLD